LLISVRTNSVSLCRSALLKIDRHSAADTTDGGVHEWKC